MKEKLLFYLFCLLSGFISAQYSSQLNDGNKSNSTFNFYSLEGKSSRFYKRVNFQKPLMELPELEFDIRVMGIFQYAWVPSIYNDKYQGVGLGIGLRLAGNEGLFVPFVGLDLDFGNSQDVVLGYGSPSEKYSYLFLRGSAGIRPQYSRFKPSFAVGGSFLLYDLELYFHLDAEFAFHVPLNYYTDLRASINVGHSIPADGSYYDEKNIMFLPKIGVAFHTY
jgi:hypothetical protein